MNEERERACDESVIEQNARPESLCRKHSQGLRILSRTAESLRLRCFRCGFKERILRIMAQRSGAALTSGEKLVLAAAAYSRSQCPLESACVHGQAAAAGSSNSGRLRLHTADLPKYEVASDQASKSGDGRVMMMTTRRHVPPWRADAIAAAQAFGVEEDRILGAPAWVKSNRYDIEAKVAPEDAPKLKDLKVEQRSAMMLPLLVERFNLKYHHENRELPMYALVVAKGGLKMKPTKRRSGCARRRMRPSREMHLDRADGRAPRPRQTHDDDESRPNRVARGRQSICSRTCSRANWAVQSSIRQD